MIFVDHWDSPLLICLSMSPFQRQITELQPCAESRFFKCGTNNNIWNAQEAFGVGTLTTVRQNFLTDGRLSSSEKSSSKSFVTESSFKEVYVTMSLFSARTVTLPLLAKSLVSSAQRLWFYYINEFPVGQGLCPGDMSPLWDVQSLKRNRRINVVLCSWVMGSLAAMRNSGIESSWNARACGRKSLPCRYSKTLG